MGSSVSGMQYSAVRSLVNTQFLCSWCALPMPPLCSRASALFIFGQGVVHEPLQLPCTARSRHCSIHNCLYFCVQLLVGVMRKGAVALIPMQAAAMVITTVTMNIVLGGESGA